MTAPPDDNAADLYGVIAVLRSERDALLVQKTALVEELAARTAELLERKTEFGEQIAQQAATIDVLKVMSTSPGDPQPVFDLIVERARTCCGAELAALTLLDGDLLRLNATSGMTAARNQEFARAYPLPVSQAFAGGRAILTRDTVQVPDTQVDPGFAQRGTGAWHRSVLAVPLLRAGLPIGAIGLGRATPGTFSAAQVELLKIFAEQAVIAIGSAETFRALQERTHDLQESLEYQTATSDVLQTISRAAYDLDSVLTTLLVTAERLCDANHGQIWRKDGEVFRYAASHMNVPAYREKEEETEIRAGRGTLVGRVALEGRPVLIADAWHDPEYADQKGARLAEARSMLGVPLLRDGELIGAFALARRTPVPFTDRQVDLVRTFADQAVIAMENARLITEQREALEQQTATAEVLQVINASPGDLAPVFEVILEKAHRLCGVTHGSLELCDGETFRAVATLGFSDDFADILRRGYPGRDSPDTRSLIDGARFSHILDLAEMNDEMTRSALDLDGHRTLLCVPLRRDGQLLGMIASARKEVRAFTDKEVALLESFAAQAVIAMENARLINEQREALEQQTATAEVLGVINASPGNLAPVFDAMLEKALRLCESAFGILAVSDGFRRAYGGDTRIGGCSARAGPSPPGLALHRVVQGEDVVQIADIADDEAYRIGIPARRHMVDLGGARTQLLVALRKDDALLGVLLIFRQEVRAFTDKQIALLRNFAAQAVIAMENARLLDEIRQRQEELRVTFENMGDGVAMFDETQHLVAWNRKFQDILDVPDDIIARRQTFSEYVHYLAARGEYDPEADPEEHVRGLIEQAGQSRTYERTRPDGRVIEIRHNPVPGGGFVLIYADITERKRNEAEIRAARDAAEEASRTIEAAYRELKTAQANLIQAEKMASLGQLTAGIAHEIKNPLNFVNNFAALSVDLLSELKETAAPGFAALTDAAARRGRRRLVHADQQPPENNRARQTRRRHRQGDAGTFAWVLGERHTVDLNALIDEALNLAYHGARAQDQSFNITLERDFGEGIAPIEVNPQDMTRVLLNIFANGFYATARRARSDGNTGFVPTLKVTTRNASDAMEIRVRDNGTGIPADIRDKLFQPFFTTKPTGEGTGLGLSITYDIVTKAHGGSIAVDSEVGEYSEFAIRLPRKP